jgi:hypothetical protein
MKKVLLLFWWLAFCAMSGPAKEPSKPTNFSGNWVLDFGLTKNLPAGLEGYGMAVNQDQQQLKVGILLRGNLQATPNMANSGGYPGGPSRGNSGGGRGGRGGGMGGGGMGGGMGGSIGRGGRGASGGGSGMPSGGDGWPRVDGASPGKVAAYKLYPQSAVYKLDGSESTVQFGDSGQTAATSKAEWVKNSEVLKLSAVGNEDPGQRGGKIEVKDQWRFSEDGKSLLVDRSIKSPEGSGTVHLVFFRKEVGPPGGAAPTTQ